MPIRTESLTTYYKGKANALINEASISKAYLPKPNNLKPDLNIKYCKYKALWDIGATNTVITRKVAEDCGLQPTGMKRVIHYAPVEAARSIKNVVVKVNLFTHVVY